MIRSYWFGPTTAHDRAVESCIPIVSHICLFVFLSFVRSFGIRLASVFIGSVLWRCSMVMADIYIHIYMGVLLARVYEGCLVGPFSWLEASNVFITLLVFFFSEHHLCSWYTYIWTNIPLFFFFSFFKKFEYMVHIHVYMCMYTYIREDCLLSRVCMIASLSSDKVWRLCVYTYICIHEICIYIYAYTTCTCLPVDLLRVYSSLLSLSLPVFFRSTVF